MWRKEEETTEEVKLSEIHINPKNPRLIKDERFKKLCKSIEEFPKMMSLRPIIVDSEGMILGGNMRFKALKELGYKDIPDEWVRRADTLTEAEKQRFIISDNVPFGDWDLDIIKEWDKTQLLEWGLELPYFVENTIIPKTSDDCDENWSEPDGIPEKVGYRLSSIWYDLPMKNEVFPYMMELPIKQNAHPSSWLASKYSRTNATATERIVKTYMREGDLFFEMCCGWMTFSSTAKYFGFSGKGGDIWDVSLNFCKEQIKRIPGKANVEVIFADCLDTKEPNEYYDFVHSNPPFFSLEPYGESEKDLASLEYEGWLKAMAGMAKEAERILKKGGLANFVINDYRKSGYLVPMHVDFVKIILDRTSLKLHDFVVSEVNSFAITMRKKDYEKRRTVKCHEYVITFKKK